MYYSCFYIFYQLKNVSLDGGATMPPFTRPDPLGQGSNFLGSGKPPYPTPGKPIGIMDNCNRKLTVRHLNIISCIITPVAKTFKNCFRQHSRKLRIW